MCFYQSYAREIAEAKGWKRLATNSAKLVNILGGYGYRPMLASMEACVDAAVSGKIGAHMTRQDFSRASRDGTDRARDSRWWRNDGFSARYDLDRIAGIFSRPAHKLAGQSYVGKILVLDTAKGGVAIGMDAARDAIARHRAARARLQLRQSDPRAGRGLRRRADARRI